MEYNGQYWYVIEECYCCYNCRKFFFGQLFLSKNGDIYCFLECSRGMLVVYFEDKKYFLYLYLDEIKYYNVQECIFDLGIFEFDYVIFGILFVLGGFIVLYELSIDGDSVGRYFCFLFYYRVGYLEREGFVNVLIGIFRGRLLYIIFGVLVFLGYLIDVFDSVSIYGGNDVGF